MQKLARLNTVIVVTLFSTTSLCFETHQEHFPQVEVFPLLLQISIQQLQDTNYRRKQKEGGLTKAGNVPVRSFHIQFPEMEEGAGSETIEQET